ncbi:bacterial transcriptional activator domain-containing protein [Tessaracoccus aquimaris]|nr:bacterial transcriptional activator domain-containing protein [Tessaracoccus aquimaris]
MSRLRSWLGSAPDGDAYLPDAYSGRIRLDPRVTSDWERFEALLAGGVNLASTAAIRQALRLVRGEPLGPLAFQWHWAETMRADMVAMIVDAASVLADRAIDQRDPDLALWAVARGRLAAPEDDELSVREIHALAIAGRRSDLERAVVALNRTVRATNRDLPQNLARRVQLAIHLSAPRPSAEAE